MEEEVFYTRRTTAAANATIAVALLIAAWCVGLFSRAIDPIGRIGVLAGGTLMALFIWRDALIRVRLQDRALIAEYVLRRRVIPYAEIAGMGIEEEIPTRSLGQSGPLREVIVLRRRSGLAVVLRNFDDDIAAPFGALQRRWSTWMDQMQPGWRSALPPTR